MQAILDSLQTNSGILACFDFGLMLLVISVLIFIIRLPFGVLKFIPFVYPVIYHVFNWGKLYILANLFFIYANRLDVQFAQTPAIAIFALMVLFSFVFAVSEVMPMNLSWPYTKNGPLAARAKLDVFYPFLLVILFLAVSFIPAIQLNPAVNYLVEIQTPVFQWFFNSFDNIFNNQISRQLVESSIDYFEILFIAIWIFLLYRLLDGLRYTLPIFRDLKDVISYYRGSPSSRVLYREESAGIEDWDAEDMEPDKKTSTPTQYK